MPALWLPLHCPLSPFCPQGRLLGWAGAATPGFLLPARSSKLNLASRQEGSHPACWEGHVGLGSSDVSATHPDGKECEPSFPVGKQTFWNCSRGDVKWAIPHHLAELELKSPLFSQWPMDCCLPKAPSSPKSPFPAFPIAACHRTSSFPGCSPLLSHVPAGSCYTQFGITGQKQNKTKKSFCLKGSYLF